MELCASRPVLGFRTGGRTHNHILALGNVLPLAEKRSGQFSLHIPAVLEAPLAHFHTHALHHRFCILPLSQSSSTHMLAGRARYRVRARRAACRSSSRRATMRTHANDLPTDLWAMIAKTWRAGRPRHRRASARLVRSVRSGAFIQ